MEFLDSFIADLTLIIFAAAAAAVILKKLKQPVVLGYIIAGFLISPNFEWLPTVVHVDDITVWSDIGMIFLMFGIGLEFNFRKIAEVGKSAIITAMTVITAMTAIGYLAGIFMGWSPMTSIFLGGMLSMSSTMIILKSYEEMGLKEQHFAEVVMGVLIIEDILGIFMMIILSTISVSRGVTDISILVSDLGMLILYLIVWFIMGIYIIPSLMKKASDVINEELLLLIAIAICLVMTAVANIIGFSSALGAFLGGSIISGTIYGEKAEQLVKPVKDIFGAVFFVSVGMKVVPSMLVQYIVPILILTAVTVLGQMTFAAVGMILSGQRLHTAIRGGFSMVQIGEFSFILASLGSELGVIDDFLYPVVVCISIITTFMTPFFIRKADGAYAFTEKHMPDRVRKFKESYMEKEDIQQENDQWNMYMKKYFIRNMVYVCLIMMVYLVGVLGAAPFIMDKVPGLAGELVSAVLVIMCMMPFIVQLCSHKSFYHIKLWLISEKNHLPLVTMNSFKYIYAIVMIIATIRGFFSIPHAVLIPAAFVLLGIIVHSDFIYGNTKKMEMKFITNMNEKTLAAASSQRRSRSDHSWLDMKMHVCRITVPEIWNGLELEALRHLEYFRANVICVKTGSEEHLMPSSEHVLNAGDIIDIMAAEEQLSTCIELMSARNIIKKEDAADCTLHEYLENKRKHNDTQLVCCVFKIGRDSEFYRKSIKTCGFREKYKGSIIGIERDGLPICNPDIRLTLQRDDIIWVLGKEAMAEQLIVSGCLENKDI